MWDSRLRLSPTRGGVLQGPLHRRRVEGDRLSVRHRDGRRLEGEGVGVRRSSGQRDQGRGRPHLQLRFENTERLRDDLTEASAVCFEFVSGFYFILDVCQLCVVAVQRLYLHV